MRRWRISRLGKRVKRDNLRALRFSGISNIVRWPDLTIVLDVPVKDIKPREMLRENRAYTQGDLLLSTLVAEMYKVLARKAPDRVKVIDGRLDSAEISAKITALVKVKNLERFRK